MKETGWVKLTDVNGRPHYANLELAINIIIDDYTNPEKVLTKINYNRFSSFVVETPDEIMALLEAKKS